MTVFHIAYHCVDIYVYINEFSSGRLLTKFDNELAINLALSINCNMKDIFFVISSPFLSILVTTFSNGTVKVMYFSVFSPRQVNCFLSFSANSFMIIW